MILGAGVVWRQFRKEPPSFDESEDGSRWLKRMVFFSIASRSGKVQPGFEVGTAGS